MLLSPRAHGSQRKYPTLVKNGSEAKFIVPLRRLIFKVMLQDCARIQVHDIEFVNKKRIRAGKNPFEPLYTPDDATKAIEQLVPQPYSKPFKILDNVEVTFHDAGHILGSAFTEINYSENGSGTKKLMFTGDIGRRDIPILKDPVAIRKIDYLITESTYGNRLHPPAADAKAELKKTVDMICQTKGKIIIPAFSVGRTQYIVYMLNKLYTEGRFALCRFYVDCLCRTPRPKFTANTGMLDEGGAVSYQCEKPFILSICTIPKVLKNRWH
jgi:metallo-beta-lactamase family protein